MTKPSLIAATIFASMVYNISLGHAQVAGDAVESVQIRSIDLDSQVLELHNFGAGSQPLDGWRFCSHDETDGFDYTSPGGLNGQSLAAGESLFVHWNNDATGSNAINVSSLLGAWIDDLLAPTAGSAVSIGIYRDSSGFGNPASLVDHIQYSFGGVNASSPANARTSVATSADLWESASDWIAVGADSTGIVLVADPFPGAGAAHSSASYSVIPEPTTAVMALLGLVAMAAGRRNR